MTLTTGFLTVYMFISSLTFSFKQHQQKVMCYENRVLGYALKIHGEQFSFIYNTFAMGELLTRIEMGVLEKTLGGNILLEVKTMSYFSDFTQKEVIELPNYSKSMAIRLEKRRAHLLDAQNIILKKCPCKELVQRI